MLSVTHTSSVTEEQIDHLGHMNVRFYGTNAHAATAAVLASLDGWPEGVHLVHDTYTRHHREQMLGTPLLVRSGVLAADTDGITLHHELVPANAEALAATFVHRVSPTGPGGARLPVPRAAIDAALDAVVAQPPYAAPRTIDLTSGPLAVAPSLELVRNRDLAMRKPRAVDAEECDELGSYRPDMLMMLIWGGEPPDGVTGWGPELSEGPNGELMGWAVMETRVQLDRLPTVGTRIQSFGATIAVHERATHRAQWCYDLDRGEVLCAFEAVDVAFDTRARTTMVIPDEFRRRQEAALHPDLAPRPHPAE